MVCILSLRLCLSAPMQAWSLALNTILWTSQYSHLGLEEAGQNGFTMHQNCLSHPLTHMARIKLNCYVWLRWYTIYSGLWSASAVVIFILWNLLCWMQNQISYCRLYTMQLEFMNMNKKCFKPESICLMASRAMHCNCHHSKFLCAQWIRNINMIEGWHYNGQNSSSLCRTMWSEDYTVECKQYALSKWNSTLHAVWV